MIPAQGIRSIVDLVSPFLARVIPYTKGKESVESILHSAIKGSVQLWICAEYGGAVLGIVVTELVTYNLGKSAIILMIAGDGIHRSIHNLEKIEKWAKREGCDNIQLYGRKGWGRMLPDYELSYHVFEKEL